MTQLRSHVQGQLAVNHRNCLVNGIEIDTFSSRVILLFLILYTMYIQWVDQPVLPHIVLPRARAATVKHKNGSTSPYCLTLRQSVTELIFSSLATSARFQL